MSLATVFKARFKESILNEVIIKKRNSGISNVT